MSPGLPVSYIGKAKKPQEAVRMMPIAYGGFRPIRSPRAPIIGTSRAWIACAPSRRPRISLASMPTATAR